MDLIDVVKIMQRPYWPSLAQKVVAGIALLFRDLSNIRGNISSTTVRILSREKLVHIVQLTRYANGRYGRAKISPNWHSIHGTDIP